MKRVLLGAALISCLAATVATATQTVFLDFDSRTGGGDRVYTTADRDAVIELVEEDFAGFDFIFTGSEPASGDYSTIFLNSGSPLGLADNLDFRNLNPNDTAEVNVDGIGLSTSSFHTISANVISHELGHILGLRHWDSFGPIGSGYDPNTVSSSDYLPSYPGPGGATETRFHLMESDSIGGVEFSTDQYFSERSLVKLAFNESGTVIGELPGNNNSIGEAQPAPLDRISVPNNLESGVNAGMNLFADAVVVTGATSNSLDTDFYAFEAEAGDLFNFQVYSETLDRLPNTLDPQITIRDANGDPVPYYSGVAENDDNWECCESIVLDLIIPEDGAYYAEVEGSGFSGVDRVGSYELFMFRFIAMESLPGDANGDGVVNLIDLDILGEFFRQSVDPFTSGDFNGDGLVTLVDLDILGQNFVTGATSLPEPMTGLLLVLGAGFFRRR